MTIPPTVTPPEVRSEPEDRLVRVMLFRGGTRVWEETDVEQWRLDMVHLRDRRQSYADRRLRWGKFKMAILIAIGGSVVAVLGPTILPAIQSGLRALLLP